MVPNKERSSNTARRWDIIRNLGPLANGYRKLDTELIDVEKLKLKLKKNGKHRNGGLGSGDPLQQPGSWAPGNWNNGHLSQTDQIKLNLLRNIATRQLNKMGAR